ncbi:hypothetical protein J8J14_22580 [Roseomonas sp. SSH11]|uniref:Tripartite tricarboxylate transporter TctB family protein n=1 Tax=Pararoseomonas baculiformis TaxID=2820812 RepID=A0ABS4AMT4_9PROT|nr:hypothetical protein [Pararoseomonas baculiformis]MBP0447549.1 hypothetical protein [Pararoseomonas baculiformis]
MRSGEGGSATREETRMEVRGFAPIKAAVAGMVVWAVHFGIVYGITGIACERGYGTRILLGQPLIPALVLAATALALLFVGWIVVSAYRRLDSELSGEDGEDGPQFTVWLTLAIALLSALAILWEGIPVLLVHPCA